MPDVSRETMDRLKTLVTLVEKWNRHINLVANATVPHIWSRHIQDSAKLIPLIPSVPFGTDLGSGAGFPD